MSFILLDLYLVLLVIMSIYGFYKYEIITIYVFILCVYTEYSVSEKWYLTTLSFMCQMAYI